MLIYQFVVLLLLVFLFAFVLKNLRDLKRLEPPSSREPGPLVSVLIPARNEECNIQSCVQSALSQTYAPLEVVVLDDFSTDSTAAIVEHCAGYDRRVRLVKGRRLPEGWTGKNHALQQLAATARGDWLLFCDADTFLEPGCVAAVVKEARAAQLDALSLFPRQVVGTLAEKLVIPLIFFILTAYLPIRQVLENRRSAYAAGCGQFFFVRKSVFNEIGGMEEIKKTLHDGPKLAFLLKKKGKRYNLFDGQKLVSCRMYRGLRPLWGGLSRSFYDGLRSPALLFGNVLWHLALFVLPAVFLAAGLWDGKPALPWITLPSLQLAVAAALRWIQNRRFALPRWPALLTPVSIALFCALQIHSFLRHELFHSVVWKGRRI